MKWIVFLAVLALASAQAALAGDVYVKGYYRSDGTYVRPHIRSSPDAFKWNNYGPSQSDSQLLSPRTRDYDSDGTPNYLDMNSDNDPWLDDYDSNPYGGSGTLGGSGWQ